MRGKKAAVKSTTKKKRIPSENRTEDGILKLDDVTRLTLLRLDAEVRATDAELVVKRGFLQSYIRSVDPQGIIGRTQNEIQALNSRRETMSSEYKTTCADIEEKLGITMAEYSFDDASGTLHKVKPNEDQTAKQ